MNGSKCQFEQGVSKCQFEPVHKNSNRDGFKLRLPQGRRECEFEPLMKNEGFETGNGNVDTKVENLETTNGKNVDYKTKNKAKLQTPSKYSNHIEFVDYIPTHEVITYRHLFAYGFYVE